MLGIQRKSPASALAGLLGRVCSDVLRRPPPASPGEQPDGTRLGANSVTNFDLWRLVV